MNRDRTRRQSPALRVLVTTGALCLVPVAGAGLAHAQEAAEERSQSFQAVKGAVQEDVPGGPLLVAAYGVIWLLVLAYVIRLVRLQQQSARDLARLSAQLSAHADKPASAS